MHIVHAIEHKEWPVSINFSAGDESDVTSSEKECSEVITITTDHGISRNTTSGNNISQSKKRKRHIAIDVETERGKNYIIIIQFINILLLFYSILFYYILFYYNLF